MPLSPMVWKDDRLLLLDQRELPHREVWLELCDVPSVVAAIRDMAVRGAPAIGIAAAYGMALAALNGDDRSQASANLAASRPTAVNLSWALDRMAKVELWTFDRALAEAQAIEREDLACNQAIGRHGSELVRLGMNVLTVCNTGSLATAGYGTAFGILLTAHQDGKGIHVYSCETRPRQQGLKLTAWELGREHIPFHAIPDGAAASLMRGGKVDLVVAGADRIARNGDTANKIGTYSLAVLAKHHGIPFVIAAPESTIDRALPDGSGIPIEERDPSELTEVDGHRVAPEYCPVWNPAFDVTPGELITHIVTERGVFSPPFNFSSEGN